MSRNQIAFNSLNQSQNNINSIQKRTTKQISTQTQVIGFTYAKNQEQLNYKKDGPVGCDEKCDQCCQNCNKKCLINCQQCQINCRICCRKFCNCQQNCNQFCSCLSGGIHFIGACLFFLTCWPCLIGGCCGSWRY